MHKGWFRFNVRVYGILIDEGAVLVSDEFVFGRQLTKFPGGGLDYGEGLKEALEREWLEETGMKIAVREHFYTTDFFVPSAAGDGSQVISVFYLVEAKESFQIDKRKEIRHDGAMANGEVLRWIALNNLNEADFELPIEKVVVRKLREVF